MTAARLREFVADTPAEEDSTLAAARSALSRAFTVTEEPGAAGSGTHRRTWLDTFDWRLYKAGLTLQFETHRDTWFSAPFCQVNWWMPVYDIVPENAMAFHPRYFDHGVANSSRNYDYDEWVATGRTAAATQVSVETRPQPELEQEIIAFVKSNIAGFKAPRTVRFVDSLPRSEAGKLMKSELKARYAGT